MTNGWSLMNQYWCIDYWQIFINIMGKFLIIPVLLWLRTYQTLVILLFTALR